MKNVLIIYPHWPPSNLAGVHRARLISNFMPSFGWHPIVLTVKHDFYEEEPDFDFVKTVNPATEVIYTKARRVKSPRIIGDIGLRAFSFMKKEALKIIATRNIDFIWIPIPSFYTAVLGRLLHNKTKTPYGIDYIDPWVRNISNRKTFRAVASNLAARVLEPYAVKKAVLISGVSSLYYKDVLERNFKQKTSPASVAMPYGFDPNDHNIIPDGIQFPWAGISDCKPIVYAGAFLPMSGYFVDILFKSIKKLLNEGVFDKNTKLFFLGTGNYTHKSVAEYAQEAGIAEYVVEIRTRFPFLHILQFLSNSFANIIIGSTEKHYTASKTFQYLLSGRPVFSVFHEESSAVNIMKECKAEVYTVQYKSKESESIFSEEIYKTFADFICRKKEWKPDLQQLNRYSAKESTAKLVKKMEEIL